MNSDRPDPQAPLFQPLELGSLTLPNRILRSATYEGLADREGMPQVEGLARTYTALAKGGVGAIVTGFNAVSQDGRAMHPGQCGMDTPEKARAWARILEMVRAAAPEVPMVAQLAHTGRQTREEITGQPVMGASSRECGYFKQPVHTLDEPSIRRIIKAFGDSALRARDAGFDGVQIHGAHGYLIHQTPGGRRTSSSWRSSTGSERPVGHPFPCGSN